MIRECNFDPEKWLEPLKDDENVIVVDQDTGREVLTLPTEARVMWFNTYCEERNIYGYIDDSEVRLEPIANSREIPSLCIVTASVFMGDKLVGKSSASTPFYGHGTCDKSIVSITGTKAKGRALANAGFNVSKTLAPDPNSSDNANGGTGKPVETEVDATDIKPVAETPVAEQPPVTQPVGVTAAEENKSALKPEAKMTLDEALAFMWPGAGKTDFSGKSLGEIAKMEGGLNKIGVIALNAGSYSKRYPELVEACRIVATSAPRPMPAE